jgi:hypothetical protein
MVVLTVGLMTNQKKPPTSSKRLVAIVTITATSLANTDFRTANAGSPFMAMSPDA